jgi:hypothetical protein
LLSTTQALGSFTLSNVEFCFPMMMLDDKTFGSLNSSVNNYDMDVHSVFNYQVAVEANSKSENHIIPARYSSVNSLILMMRNSDDAQTINKMKYSSRSANNLISLQAKHKGGLYPKQALTRSTNGTDGIQDQNARVSAEMYFESLGTYNSINSGIRRIGDNFVLRSGADSVSNAGQDGNQQFSVCCYEKEDGSNITVTSATNLSSNLFNKEIGTFFCGIPLSAYRSKELNTAVYSGLNSQGDDIFVATKFGNTGVKHNSFFEYYIHYNAVISLDKSTLQWEVVN